MPALRGLHSKKKTRRKTRDVDQIAADLRSPRHLAQHLSYIGAAHSDSQARWGDGSELPGAGQHYCVECARHFDGARNLESHRRGKVHRRRIRELRVGAVGQREVEEAVGLRREDGCLSRRREEGKAEAEAEMDVDVVEGGGEARKNEKDQLEMVADVVE